MHFKIDWNRLVKIQVSRKIKERSVDLEPQPYLWKIYIGENKGHINKCSSNLSSFFDL